MSREKVPPHSTEAEQSILGCMLMNERAVPMAFSKIRPEDFYRPNHTLIYQCMNEIFVKHDPIDLVTVTSKLNEKNQYNNTEDIKYLSEMTHIIPTVDNLGTYIEIVKEKSKLRKLANVCYNVVDDVFNESDNAFENAMSGIFNLATEKRDSSLKPIEGALMRGYQQIADQQSNEGGLLGFPTGYKNLDNVLSGLQVGQLIIVAGRPGHGKTAFALNIVTNLVWRKQKDTVAIFSFEMSEDEVANPSRLFDEGEIIGE